MAHGGHIGSYVEHIEGGSIRKAPLRRPPEQRKHLKALPVPEHFLVPVGSLHHPLWLHDIWSAFVAGRLCIAATHVAVWRCFVSVRKEKVARVPSRFAVHVAERVFSGEQPKVVAAELSISVATVCHHCKSVATAFSEGALASGSSTLLVMAACAARGARIPPARLHGMDHDGNTVLSVEMPNAVLNRAPLSQAERTIAWAVVEGKSHAEICAKRGTSPRTVANQLNAIYRKLRVSGRRELMAVALSAAWVSPELSPSATGFAAPRAEHWA
jgi:DNA-binding CsgD family transcriptional regulator